MPLVNFHLVNKNISETHVNDLIKGASKLYADVLECPMDRVRVYVNLHKENHVGVGGELVSINQKEAPYFEFIVLLGRSLEQRRKLTEGFTDLLVEVLGVERSVVRGCCRNVPAEDWSIGGVLASELRQDEIKKRAELNQP